MYTSKKLAEPDAPAGKKVFSVQLGFSVQEEDHEHREFVGHRSPLWRDWDGGQIGGRPSWLQPQDLPKDPLTCKNCEGPLSFICQLYAPADEVNSCAFHRSLYIFGCPKPSCAKSTTGSIRVLRTQLDKDNQFYPEEEEEEWDKHRPETWGVSLCKVCGQRGHGKCPIQGEDFCGKHHQKEHKKHVWDKKKISEHLADVFLPSVFSESELVVEEEPSDGSSGSDMAQKASNPMFGKSNDDDDDDDKELEQEDLNEMTGAAAATVSKDPTTMAFYSRVNGRDNVQSQCLRYLRWPNEDLAAEINMPLWISSDDQPKEIPSCPYCGGDRKFEFQLMPQMIHYLLQDHEIHRAQDDLHNSIRSDDIKEAIRSAASLMEQAPKEQVPPALAEAKEKAVEKVRSNLMDGDKELNWGVIAVYSCTASCGEPIDGNDLGAYREEFAWKQPSLD